MDRATRIANLKKLQLPGTQQRITRQSNKTKGISTISHHFSIKEKALLEPQVQQEVLSTSTYPTAIEAAIGTIKKGTAAKVKATPAKCTKLEEFVFKTPQSKSKTISKPENEDDFDSPEKETKKAPLKTNKAKKNPSSKVKKATKKKKQTTIKTAFLRNEELFAEIAAQHCAADNFNGDDIQLAIALSQSEAESNGIVNDVVENDMVVDGGAEQNAEKIRQKLEKYGFRTADHQDYNTFAAAFMPKAKGRRPKSKWANKFTALTLRDEQLQNKKLQQNIETFLNQQFRTRPLTKKEQKFSKLSVQSSLLRTCVKDKKKKLLNLSKNPQTEDEIYFVTELFEISKLPPGHLLKDWNAIQGRDMTPKKTFHKNEKEFKLQEIYAELEEYFRSLKESGLSNESILEKEQSFGEGKETKEIPEENKNQFENIAHEKMVPSKKRRKSNIEPNANNMLEISPTELFGNDMETVVDNASQVSLMSTDTSLSNMICKVLPSINDLDLMQVSSNSEQTELQSQKTNSNIICRVLPPINYLDLMQVSSISEQTELGSQKTNSNQQKVPSDIKREAHVLTPLKHLDPYAESLQTKASDSEKVHTVATDLMDVSSCYSLESEDVTNVNKKHCKMIAIQNVDPLQEPYNKIIDTASPLLPEVNSSNFNALQISSASTNSLAASTTQGNRSNSPDLFADSDSDVDMEDVDKNSKETKFTSNVEEKRSSASFESVEGVTTYEIFSSDEVKNFSPMANIAKKESNVNDLVEKLKSITKQNSLNQSQSIVEIDLFADSPLQEEDEASAEVVKILSNSPQSKNLKSINNEIFKITITPYEEKEKSAFKEKFSLDEEFLDPHVIEANDNNDFVLRDIEMNQKKTSFFNSDGIKQFDTCFHRETAVKEFKCASQKIPIMKTTPEELNQIKDKIFRDLCNKYLNKSSTEELKPKTTEYNLKTSFTQPLPRIVTPKSAQNESQFTMDLNVTEECNISIRKCLSFESKTPEKFRDLVNFKDLKSRSFNETICIDLTENDDVKDLTAEEEDDEHLVLSDDEINYSIWNANKTGYLNEIDSKSDIEDYEELNIKNYKKAKNSLSSPLEGALNGSLHDIQHDLDNEDYDEFNINKFKKAKKSLSSGCLKETSHDFDNEDCEELNKKKYKKAKNSLSSPLEGVPNGSLQEIQHDLVNEDYEEFNIKNYKKAKKSLSSPLEGVSPPKPVFRNSISSQCKTNNSQLDRSHFGILDEFSEPIDYVSTTAALADFSFLDSPTETSAPMKIFSSGRKTAHQLNKLVSDLEDQNPKSDGFEDYGFNTFLNESNTTTNSTLPQGLDQLMTAEISFEHASSSHLSNKNKRYSLDSDDMEEINDNLLNTAGKRNSILSYKSESENYEITESEKFEVTIKDRTYAIRNINMPKPDYTSYNEPELLKKLYEYGIKPLKRKQAIKILEYIYTQTHPLIVDDTLPKDKPNRYLKNVNDIEIASTSKASSSISSCIIPFSSQDSIQNPKASSSTSACIIPFSSQDSIQNPKTLTKASSLTSSCIIPFSSQDSIQNLSQNYSFTPQNGIKPSKEKPQNSNKLNLQDASGMEMLYNSFDVHAELDGEHYILQTNVTKKTPQPLLPLHIAWFNLICCNPNLFEKILMYEPIDLQEIYLFLKQLGYRYDPKDLKQFFDNRCIIFRYDLAAAGGNDGKANSNNRHVRRKNKK